jgi:SAM-dependent methyltransferase
LESFRSSARFLARRGDFSGKAFGVDQSRPFIEAAGRFAQTEKVSDRIVIRVGDAHGLDSSLASFDAVIAHTPISHVTEPTAVLREMARVVRPGGTVVILDGDYASLTYANPDHDFGHRTDAALANASFNNPLIMSDLPRLLPEPGLKLAVAWGDVLVGTGNGSSFRTLSETYAPCVTRAGLLPAESVDTWLAAQREATESGIFFASFICYTYFVNRAGHA